MIAYETCSSRLVFQCSLTEPGYPTILLKVKILCYKHFINFNYMTVETHFRSLTNDQLVKKFYTRIMISWHGMGAVYSKSIPHGVWCESPLKFFCLSFLWIKRQQLWVFLFLIFEANFFNSLKNAKIDVSFSCSLRNCPEFRKIYLKICG